MTSDANWHVTETALPTEHLHFKETVFTIGNGYLGTRGAFEEGYPGQRPATLIHGLFDDAPLVYTELANAPDWLPFVLVVAGERFRMDRGQVSHYRRDLDLYHGLLRRQVRWQSPQGQTVDMAIERLASLANPHLLAIRYRVTPLDFDGWLEFRAGIQGAVDNDGLAHWHTLNQGSTADGIIWLQSRTRHSGIVLAEAASLKVSGGVDRTHGVCDADGCPTLIVRCRARRGETVTADKIVTLYTTRDPQPIRQGDNPTEAAVAHQQRLLAAEQGYDALRQEHCAAWEALWQSSDVVIEGDDPAQRALRYCLFQLLIAAPRYDERASIPAKALSGFGYRGHVFWDTEIFMLPFFTFTQPQVARNLLLYRYHTLPGARRKARQAGYEGAMFAWESADTGDETTPRWLPNREGDLIRIWCGDIEHHITADVAYAVWQYWRATGDDRFMADYGAEIVLDAAVFWGSRAEYNEALGRYEITDVIGPDEWHEHVNNSAFTNVMARWTLRKGLEILAWLREHHPARAAALTQQLQLTPQRLARWQSIIERLYIPYRPESGLFEQFDRFFALEELEQSRFEPRRRAYQEILGIEGVQRYQIIKQADVVMLLNLLAEEYDERTKRANWDYYAPRTDHAYGSSLSPAFHALLAARLGLTDEAYHFFRRAVFMDLENSRGNTADGVHAANCGGVWQAVVFGFAGVHLTPDGIATKPSLPSHWRRLQFQVMHRGRPVAIELGGKD